jgi:membrane-bound lytic murein transglycosylase B
MKMKNFKMLALVPAAILAVACGPSDNKKVDDALNSDLTLAAQARPFTAQDSISAAERAYAAQGLAPVGYAPAAAPVAAPTRTRVVYRDRPVYRSSSSSGTYSRPTTVVKHTKRDAAIGAAAGAVIGATTSRSKVKGGLIGAAVGGILGGVIGNNVDKQKKPPM